MSERNDKTIQAPDEGAHQAPTTESTTGFGRADNLLAAGNEDSGERAREALARIETRPTKDRAPRVNDADSLTQSGKRDEGDEAEREANENRRRAGRKGQRGRRRCRRRQRSHRI